ncbi:MAG: hypothetical protein KJ648_07095 [Candidatus Omnitrophica bacterium]|nr:hypothetical protein [Candidatus Omnitrophota bacterium]MBU1767849.1 hypothetical protein [Candidatus Omnitrophota bacterium]
MISVVQNKKDSRPFRLDVSWAELVADLTTLPRRCVCTVASCLQRDCEHKDGPGWCPCTFAGDHRLKANVEAVTVLVVDIDHQPPGNYNALLEEAGITHVVHSTHSHRDDDWCLRVVVPLSRPVTPTEWPRFRAAALARFRLPNDEATKDASRLFFLPSTPSDGPFLGFEEKGKVLDVDEILGAPAVAGLAPTPPSKEPASKPVAAPGVLNPRKGVADMDWLRATLKRLKDDASQALANLMLAGKPLAVEGGRDAALQRLAGILAFSLPTSTPIEAFLELARASVLALPGEPPSGYSDWMPAFESKLLRSLSDRSVSDLKKAAFKEEIQKRYRKAAAAAGTPEEPDEREEPADDPTAPYTPQQVARWASEQGCDPSEFYFRWIVSAGKAFWVFSEGKYQPPISRDDLEVSILRDLARAPDVTLYYQKEEDGNLVYVAPKSILRDYSTVARHVEASLALQRSYYDAATQTFHEAVCPMRPLTPKENPDIQKWLEMLGGDQADKLLDWVATYTNLSRQTCAIYLHSGPSTGKSLLSQGLAKIWTAGGPSELDSVVGGFNSVLTVCPLVVADESLPKDGKGITTVLRRLIGTTTRNLNRKFMATCNLRGAVRLIICANNDRLLETGEELTNADLEAVAGRFLYLDTSNPDASERLRNYLLEEITPEVVNSEWLDNDGIARHALWLARTRPVNSTGRFLVEGRQTEFHRGLVTASGVTSSVAEFLTKWVSHPGQGYAGNDLVQVGNGQIWVATEVFGKANWENLVPSLPLPSATRVGRALTNLSNGAVRALVNKRQLTFHRVQPGLLVAWAQKAQVGDLDYLQKRLASDNKVVTAWDRRVEAKL